MDSVRPVTESLLAPEIGLKLLFFGGGSALKTMSKILKTYTHNSIHILTAFDSGGSTGELRRCFDMPGIGDVRSRVLALANPNLAGFDAVEGFLSYRFSRSELEANRELLQMTRSEHPLMQALPSHLRDKYGRYLYRFLIDMPRGFKLREACVGNLILVGAWQANRASWADVVDEFAADVGARGTVRLVVEQSLHLVATDDCGVSVFGQHNITAAERPPHSITGIQLSTSSTQLQTALIGAEPEILNLIRHADLICYPPGSFYTSLIASLMPAGIASAIAECSAPKVYIANLGRDPELYGKTLIDCINELVAKLRQNSAIGAPVSSLLNYVLVEPSMLASLDNEQQADLRDLGLSLVAVSRSGAGNYYDVDQLCQTLVDLAM